MTEKIFEFNRYRFSQVTIGEQERFIEAWESSFDRRLSKDVYGWIFNKNNLIYVVQYDDEVAAGLCLYPIEVVVNGQSSKGLLANNGFTSPRHRGKNLFVKVSEYAFANAKAQGFALAYGISNELILPSHKRVGWSLMFPLQFLERQRLKIDEKDGVLWVEGFLNEQQRIDIEECSRRCSLKRGFSVIKTKEFIQWRYENKPNSRYWFALKYQSNSQTLSAYAVCKYYPESQCLHFLDIDGCDLDMIKEIIESANSLRMSFNKLNVWASSAHSEAFILKGYQSAPEERSFILINPGEKSPVTITGAINLVLGDNEVY